MSSLQILAAAVAWVVTVVGWSFFITRIVKFVNHYRLGQPEAAGARTHRPGTRVVTLIREFLGHTRMARKPGVAVAHWVTMIGFGFLTLTLLQATFQVAAPTFNLPIIGHFIPYEWITELLAVAGFLGIIYLIGLRQVKHPRRYARGSRFYKSVFWQAYVVEYVILGVCACIIVLRGAEYQIQLRDGGASALHFPLTFWLGDLFAGTSTAAILGWIVTVALLKILISYAWMVIVGLNQTMGVAWHRFLAFFNIYFKRHAAGRTSLGELQPMRSGGKEIDFENIDELDEDTSMGVGSIEDFTWKGLLDFNTCTECGRCQEQCPAWNTDKPLSPKLMVMALREHAEAKAPWLKAADDAAKAAGDDADVATIKDPHENLDLLGTLSEDVQKEAVRDLVGSGTPSEFPESGGVFDPDALWSCTMCGACVEQCPVDIEHVDHMVDMRRYQVLIESAFPTELGGLFKNLENKSNPWGMNQRKRLDWAKNLDFEVKQVGRDVDDLEDVEYLLWVGCAGAFEERAVKTTQALAELLHMADVDFAVLGDGESCTGDPARRAGNEFLYQMLAQANVEALHEAKAKKIVVECAHCFNTIANEYPQLGGKFEVVHHTQLLNKLVRDKRLVPIAPEEREAKPTPITYHDPCYLGRHNGIYTPPRDLIESIPNMQYREMERSGEKSFCCGAGGARMWMEEKLGTRINDNRTAEAVGTGADKIAIGCPFCKVMLSDGLSTAQAEGSAREEVQVQDVAQMLLESVKRPGAGSEKEPEPAS